VRRITSESLDKNVWDAVNILRLENLWMPWTETGTGIVLFARWVFNPIFAEFVYYRPFTDERDVAFYIGMQRAVRRRSVLCEGSQTLLPTPCQGVQVI
jgi:hypothetical protein